MRVFYLREAIKMAQSTNNKGNTAQFMAHALLVYYSVRVPKNQHPYVSMHTDYLYTLAKNLTAQSAHQNYAVLPKIGI